MSQGAVPAQWCACLVLLGSLKLTYGAHFFFWVPLDFVALEALNLIHGLF